MLIELVSIFNVVYLCAVLRNNIVMELLQKKYSSIFLPC